MRHAPPLWLSVAILAGCGAAGPGAAAPDRSSCDRAIADAAIAWRRAEADADTAATPERAPLAAEQVLDRLEGHLAELERAPREVPGEEAFALSSALMDAIDGMGAEVPVGLRNRADDAAEALLTDRSEQGAPRAARAAAQVLELLVQAAHPGSAEDRARRRVLRTFGRRAHDAGEAYGEGPEPGDLRADRAEAVPFPDDAPASLRGARSRAVEASTAVRQQCGIQRRLSVPTL